VQINSHATGTSVVAVLAIRAQPVSGTPVSADSHNESPSVRVRLPLVPL
jgi:hypothetical protein